MAFTYSEIEHLVLQGRTPAQIATTLRDSGMTHKALPLAETRTWLREKRFLMLNFATGGYEGKLVTYATNPANPLNMRDATVEFGRRVLDPGVARIRTDQYGDDPIGMRIIVGSWITAGTMTMDEALSFYSLAGGLRFNDVTTQDVQAVIDAHGMSQAIEAVRERWELAKSAAVLAASRGEDADAAGLAVIQGGG